jgi:outer membrane protein
MRKMMLISSCILLLTGSCFAESAKRALPAPPQPAQAQAVPAPHPPSSTLTSSVTGHDFSRADCPTRTTGALAPAGCPVELLAQATPSPAGSHPNAPAAPTPSPNGPRLTLAEAEKMALAHNPNISIAHLLQLAQAQVTRQARSAEMPLIDANLTAVGAHDNTRITAGAINNPSVYDRAGAGLTARQLITDFGRTRNLVRNAQSNARAQLETERATTEDITLAVDQVFYQALTAQQVLRVAQQTVRARQTTGEQIGALTQQKLRSTLDLSLANVQVSQAQLLELDAQNSAQAAMAALNAILGSEADQSRDLADETPDNPQPAPANAEDLVQLAFRSRPDLAALNDRQLAARQFASAEHDLSRPTISALATAGGTPVRADQIQSSWYGAAGANINIPVFNGFEYSARAREADLRAQAASEQVRNMRDTIARDVRTSVLNAQIAFQRIGVSKELLDQANNALELANARYKVGLSGIVDLTQAQLAQTQAEIAYTNARYAYQQALADLRYQTGQ